MELQTTAAIGGAVATPVVPPADPAVSRHTDISFEVVGSLLTALCGRDRLTAEHSWRVSQYCIAAVETRFGFVDQLQLGIAALLHDVGKIGIPDWVLKKPGQLNGYETTVMRMHDTIGVETLRAARMNEEIVQIIHEHGTAMGTAFDYENHSPSARILRIVDAFDSMITDDVYRLGKTIPQALDEVYRWAGPQFDPQWLEVVRPYLEAGQRQIEKPNHPSRALTTRVLGKLPQLSFAMDQEDVPQIRKYLEEIGSLTDSRALYEFSKELLVEPMPVERLSEFWRAVWNEQATYLL